MNKILNSPELAYLSPTTREQAIILAQEIMDTQKLSATEAIRLAILQAKNWAVKNVNRAVWKRLRLVEKETI